MWEADLLKQFARGKGTVCNDKRIFVDDAIYQFIMEGADEKQVRIFLVAKIVHLVISGINGSGHVAEGVIRNGTQTIGNGDGRECRAALKGGHP